MEINDKPSERVEQFKYLGTTLTYLNYVHTEIKTRLKSGKACYHSVKDLLSSGFLSKNLKIKKDRIIILPLFYGYETWSLTLREENKLRVFVYKVLRRICGPTYSPQHPIITSAYVSLSM